MLQFLLKTWLGAPFTRAGRKFAKRYARRLRLRGLAGYRRELRTYRAGTPERIPFRLWPLLDDRTATTPLDRHYFHQDVWGLKKLLDIRPAQVVDVGSTALLVGAFSQIAPTTSFDIRPLPVAVDGLDCRAGSILDLPFEDGSVEYLNSLCVVEHVGLARYGDPLDPEGIDKAIRELRRVIRPGGRLVLAVPVGPSCIVFNAHRVFEREEFLALFPEFEPEDDIFCVPEYTRRDPTPDLEVGDSHVYCVVLRRRSG